MDNVVYGSELAVKLKQDLKMKIENSIAQGYRLPQLAVVLVGDDPASLSYVKGKEKACAQVGVNTITYTLSDTASFDEIKTLIDTLNQDSNVDGILLQLPLPNGLDSSELVNLIVPDKDVDGLTPLNMGYFFNNCKGFVPCTPLGVMALLKEGNVTLEGKHAVVIGRSQLVGKPLAQLLLNSNCTVTMCHSKTSQLKEITQLADILIVAVGKAKFITADYVKKGAVVIDVGVNRVDGKLVGDVDFASVQPKASLITPVPKGVGPMTITMLLDNTYQAYCQHIGKDK